MTARRRTILWVAGPVLVAFLALWIVGPRPTSMGPYVQNVTANAAEICWFDEVPRTLEVRLTGPGGERTMRDGRSAHRLRFAALVPDATHTYAVIDVKSGAELARGSFRTAPDDRAKSFSFAAVGDSGRVPAWFALQPFGWGRLRGIAQSARPREWDVGRWIAAQDPDLFVHLGDVIYSHNQLPAYDWAFFRPFEQVLRRAPLVVTFGNHDMHRWEHPEFFRVFEPPQDLDPRQKYADYSHTFTWGAVRFFVLDVFWQKWADDSPVRAWLVDTLQKNDHPRKIVVIHSPVFTDETGAQESERIRERLWPLFVRYGVDLVVSGDSHSYQRFRPVDGVTQLVVGTGGKSIRPVTPRRLAHVEERFGFLLVKVHGTRIEGEFRAGGREPLDRFVIAE